MGSGTCAGGAGLEMQPVVEPAARTIDGTRFLKERGGLGVRDTAVRRDRAQGHQLPVMSLM